MMTMMSRPERQSKRAQHAGTRTCAGCHERVPRDAVARELVHLVFVPSDADAGEMGVVVDLLGRGRRPGRGAWVHARRGCLERAAAKGLSRAAKTRVVADAAVLAEQIVAQADRRTTSLLASAQRAGKLAVGATAVSEARGAVMLLVAVDAAAAAKLPAVVAAHRDGRAVAWGDKQRLGEALGRNEVAIAAILDDGLAEAIHHAIGLAQSFHGGPSHGGACRGGSVDD
ncbi:MAG TPA: DUF448 domain-containing protein [Polyangiaceae bacterium]|nr:DUF448 domain-containing protein [Polyangiaceae bacterium]